MIVVVGYAMVIQHDARRLYLMPNSSTSVFVTGFHKLQLGVIGAVMAILNTSEAEAKYNRRGGRACSGCWQ